MLTPLKVPNASGDIWLLRSLKFTATTDDDTEMGFSHIGLQFDFIASLFIQKTCCKGLILYLLSFADVYILLAPYLLALCKVCMI